MNLTYRQLVNRTARMYRQAAIETPDSSANVLVLADLERERKSLVYIARIVYRFLTKCMLDEEAIN